MMSHYGAAKAAVINFTRSLGMAWGRKNIRVNCIAPGPVETEGYMGVLTKQDPAAAKKAYDTVASRVGHGALGQGARRSPTRASSSPRRPPRS